MKKMYSFATGYLRLLALDAAVVSLYIPLCMLAAATLTATGQTIAMVVGFIAVIALHFFIIKKTQPASDNISGRLLGGVGMATVILGILLAYIPNLASPLPWGLYVTSTLMIAESARCYVVERSRNEREDSMRSRLDQLKEQVPV